MMNGANANRATAPGPAPSAGALPTAWREIVARYAKPDARRSIIQLLNTGLPFLALFAAMLCGVHYKIWATLLLAIPAAGLLLRLFMFQHDCGHGSFFSARWANDGLGRLLGVLTLTPYAWWHRTHALHHATAGNLDRRGNGDIDTLTVREYSRARSGAGCATASIAIPWCCSASVRLGISCCGSAFRPVTRCASARIGRASSAPTPPLPASSWRWR